MKALQRAFSDTFTGLARPAFTGVIGFAITFGLYAEVFGWEVAKNEFQLWFFSVAGAVGSVGILFLYYLALAPFRIERDGRIIAETRVQELETKLAPTRRQRHLDAEQQAALTSAIRASRISPDTLNVLYFNVSEECANFATDIGEAIKNVPLKCDIHGGGMFPHNTRDRGIKIYSGKEKTLLKLADVIGRQFESFGFLTEQRETPDKNAKIYIYVARSAEND